MGLKCGIVGLPNVGKSTLFNALTKATISAENYPFCTIDPNVGIVEVPDPRIDKLASIIHPQKRLPTTVEFVDIAGLVAGASQGEGLGNQFLGHVRETDAIAHVVRCFVDENVHHVAGEIDPVNDIDVINTELTLADIDTIESAIKRVEKVAKSGDKDAVGKQAVLTRLAAHLDAGEPARTAELDANDRKRVRDLNLLTLKPTLYVANVGEDGMRDNNMLAQVTERAAKEGAEVVAVCASLEAEIAQLEDEDKADFLAELGLGEAGLDRVARATYKLLGLTTYFTAGPREVRAWTVKNGATAPQAAGVIHTDFEKGFIRAEVIAYDDYIECGGETGARDAGKWRLEGKDYRVDEGDVMHFRFNV